MDLLLLSAEEDEIIAEGVVSGGCPVPVSEAKKLECEASVIPGTYFVSVARKRICGIVDLQKRWASRRTNRCSEYTSVQRDLGNFFADMLDEFDKRYAYYTTHPAFSKIGKIRRRRTN